MRISGDEYKDGKLLNGYDYDVQAWVANGIYLDCNHPPKMKAAGCCSAHEMAGLVYLQSRKVVTYTEVQS